MENRMLFSITVYENINMFSLNPEIAQELVKNPPPAPGSLFLGVAIRSALGRDLTRVPKPNSISGKPTSRLATRHFQKTIWRE